jgi:flagella basal body P-ring formation protein FlgA
MKWALAAVLAARAIACQTVDEHITGKDLAAANPVFAAIDPDMEIGPAPMAGVSRVIHPLELSKIAQRGGIALSAPLGDICFDRATEPLTPEKILPILRNSLAPEEAQIEILDHSRFAIPRGVLEFKREGLSSAGLWRGRVVYGPGSSAPIWVKVRVTEERTWVEAAESLQSGKAIGADQLVTRKGPRFPFGAAPLDSIDLAAGRAPVRMLPAGSEIYATMLVAPREIERGDKVEVEASSGNAIVAFEATAESPGRMGESILLRNPENGRYFRARVDGKGKAAVTK